MKRLVGIIVAAVLVSLMGWTPAHAWTCPPASVGGPAVAIIKVKGKATPVKPITFRKGGALDPPHTSKAAGISIRNAPLSARRGATVITWHVRYGPGCNGTLNPLTRMPLGSTFTAGAVGKPAQTYVIESRTAYPKGTIKRWWFRKDGRHRIVLLTCNDLSGGLFRKTMAIIARPVPTPVTPKPIATQTPAPVAPAA